MESTADTVSMFGTHFSLVTNHCQLQTSATLCVPSGYGVHLAQELSRPSLAGSAGEARPPGAALDR